MPLSKRPIVLALVVVVLIAIMIILSREATTPGAEVEDCPRGTLDASYCDLDQDLLADRPIAASDQANPRQLIFSYTPVEDPAVYAQVWQGFIDHLSAVTGKPVQFFPVQSYAAQYEAMRAGRLHVAGINTGGTPVAVNCAGFIPFAMMAAADGTYGYEMEIISWPGSGIESPEDIRGRTLTFTSPTSNSGFKAPSAILKSEFGLVAEVDYKTSYSGKHDNSVLGVANRDYEAAAIANSVMKRMVDREVITPDQVQTVFRSRTFPTTAYGHAHDLTPDLAGKIKQAFFTFDWENSTLKAEFEKEDQFIPIDYQRDWAIIRQIDEANDIRYDCR